MPVALAVQRCVMICVTVPSAPMETSLTPLLVMKSSALLTLAIL